MLPKKRSPFSVELAGLRAQVGSLFKVLSGDQLLLRLIELIDLKAEFLQNSSRFCRQALLGEVADEAAGVVAEAVEDRRIKFRSKGLHAVLDAPNPVKDSGI